jgi:hypothetical protein
LSGGYPELVLPDTTVLAGLAMVALGLSLAASGLGAALTAAWDGSPLASLLYRALYLLPIALYIGPGPAAQAAILGMLSPSEALWFGLRVAVIGAALMILLGQLALRRLLTAS